MTPLSRLRKTRFAVTGFTRETAPLDATQTRKSFAIVGPLSSRSIRSDKLRERLHDRVSVRRKNQREAITAANEVSPRHVIGEQFATSVRELRRIESTIESGVGRHVGRGQ